MKRAVIFDLDGTLLNTVESMAVAGNRMLRDLGLRPQPVDRYRYYAGDGADMLVQRALLEAGDVELSRYEEAKARYRAYFARSCTYHVRPYQGILELLNGIKGRGARTAVLSNKPHRQTLEVIQAYFPGVFDAVQGQTEAVPRKPDPVGVRAILKKLNLKAEDCLYVGDTNVDMMTAHAAGIFGVGVLWGFRTREELEQNHADAIVNTPAEILQILSRE